MSLDDEENGIASLDNEEEDEASGGGEEETRSPSHGSMQGSPRKARLYNATEVIVDVFQDIDMPTDLAREVQESWARFVDNASSKEAAGEEIFSAVFEAAPSLQSMFKMPRAVMALRFMGAIHQMITSLHDPPTLKTLVETIGFNHLDLDVTAPRVAVFRDAIADLVAVELGNRISDTAVEGLRTVLNYAGGAFIYVKTNYASRLKILERSWVEANKPNEHANGGGEDSPDYEETSAEHKEQSLVTKTIVPTTFPDMFRFNSAVMGFANRAWMEEVLKSFDVMVVNASNPQRLQEECDVLSLLLAKHKGDIKLSEFKAVMLASLRAVVPKSWDSEHEVAWTWLWEHIERLLQDNLGLPSGHQRALSKLIEGLEESEMAGIRREIYTQFFVVAPSGMDFFKASTTRLHFIADKVVALVSEMYKDPAGTVVQVSRLGLQHVGWGVPTELFAPYVTAAIEVVRGVAPEQSAVDAFAWSLNLIARTIARVVLEGSTVVMRAINTNSAKAVENALACAPRGKRAQWVLNVQVGVEKISPFMWAIETGCLDAAEAILKDLTTIRADRDTYYFGIDSLFEIHPDIVKRLCEDAPGLLPLFLDGCVWRSRLTEGGRRRVIYFVRHLLEDDTGHFSQALANLTEHQDAVRLLIHPVPALVMDLVWSGVARAKFLVGKVWILVNLSIFMLSQCILNRHQDELSDNMRESIRIIIFCCRCFIYFFGMTGLIGIHVQRALLDLQGGHTAKVGQMSVPESQAKPQAVVSLTLTTSLIIMFITEPVLFCMGSKLHRGVLFNNDCEAADGLMGMYSTFSMIAMMCYYVLVADICIISTKVCAFALLISRTCADLALNLLMLIVAIIAFAAGVCTLDQEATGFDNLPDSILMLLKMTLGMVHSETYSKFGDHPMLMVTLVVYIIVAMVFISNLLVAQLTSSYESSFQDALGLARLQRAQTVVQHMASVREAQWRKFFDALELDRPCEFGEGDLGFAGGYVTFEGAQENPTVADSIKRYGGTTSSEATWPVDADARSAKRSAAERCEGLEKLLKKGLKKIETAKKKASGGGGSSVGSRSDDGSISSSG